MKNFDRYDFISFIIKNRRLPNNEEIFKLEKKYFNYTKVFSLKDTNSELKKISKEYKIKFLDKNLFMCNKLIETCDIITTKFEKIYWDGEHITVAGSYYLTDKISKLNWLNID